LYLLQIKNCTMNFGGLRALSKINMDIVKGQIHGLIGPNGAGKTTLFNVITGVYFPNNGYIEFNETEITRKKPHKISRLGISRTFQIPKPFSNISVMENILAGIYIRYPRTKDPQEKAKSILDFVGLEAKGGDLAKSLTIADLKKLEFAKALSTDPLLILLDEIMTGLTPKETIDALNLIRRVQSKGITIIIIEHIMHAIMSISERITVLNYGEKIAEGTPEEISKNEEVIKAYLGEEYALAGD
jgi:branched-chain amino acid transport system ATP-binding protein